MWKHIVATAKRNFITDTRAYPIDFFVGSILSCFYSVLGSYFIFKIMFEGKTSEVFIKYANTSDYMSYMILGGATYLFIVRTLLNVSRSLVMEMREGTLDCLLISPMSPVSYLFGNMMLQTLTTAGETATLLLITVPFGLNLSSINIPATMLCVVISLISFFGLAVLLGGIMIYLRDTYVTQNTLFAIISLVCGVAFPIQYLPNWLQFFSNIIPVTYAFKILRNSVLSGQSIASQSSDFIAFAVLSLIYNAFGLWFIYKVVKAAPERQFI